MCVCRSIASRSAWGNLGPRVARPACRLVRVTPADFLARFVLLERAEPSWRGRDMKATSHSAAKACCPRCQGPLFRAHDGDAACLYCGECVYEPTTREVSAGWDAMLPARRARVQHGTAA